LFAAGAEIVPGFSRVYIQSIQASPGSAQKNLSRLES